MGALLATDDQSHRSSLTPPSPTQRVGEGWDGGNDYSSLTATAARCPDPCNAR
jgi:hypothetical protein